MSQRPKLMVDFLLSFLLDTVLIFGSVEVACSEDSIKRCDVRLSVYCSHGAMGVNEICYVRIGIAHHNGTE